MNSNEKLSIKGNLNIVLTDAQGNIKDSRQVDNLVVTSGITYILSRMKDTTYGAMSHMAVGSSTTATAANQTDLVTLLGSRVTLTSTVSSASTIVYAASFGTGVSTGAITEAGIFNAASGISMLCRTVFNVINKGAGDSMNITWTITLTAA